MTEIRCFRFTIGLIVMRRWEEIPLIISKFVVDESAVKMCLKTNSGLCLWVRVIDNFIGLLNGSVRTGEGNRGG